jgi:ubiquinone/menaquinone biosynthesis C-methylase UbiE
VLTVEFERFELAPGSRILDIGCGSGRHTAAAGRLERAQVVGVDLALGDLAAAAERLRLHERLGDHGRGGWLLCAADGLRLPFGAERFDLVICSEVLEHVADPGRAAAEIARVLKPGGQLAVSVPRFWPERVCWRLSRDYAPTPGGHIRIYRRRELIALLSSAGLTPRAAHHAHGLHTPYWWLKCLVGPERKDVAGVNLYHRFLTWEMMKKPPLVRFVERLLNPVIGKSLVVYLRKNARGRYPPRGAVR